MQKIYPCKIISSHKDNDGRILLVNIEINKVEYSICNVYCPNDVSDRIAFFHYVKQFVKCYATSTANTLIGGDFNCADDPMDKFEASRSTDKSSIESVLEAENGKKQFLVKNWLLRGKGYWKLDNSVIEEENHKEGIIKLCNDAIEEYGDDVPNLFCGNFLKLKLKNLASMYCIAKSRANKQTIEDLEARLDTIDRLNESQDSDKYIEKKAAIRSFV